MSVAKRAGLAPLKVMMERVWAPVAAAPYLQLRFQVQMGPNATKGQRLVDDLKVGSAALPAHAGALMLAL